MLSTGYAQVIHKRWIKRPFLGISVVYDTKSSPGFQGYIENMRVNERIKCFGTFLGVGGSRARRWAPYVVYTDVGRCGFYYIYVDVRVTKCFGVTARTASPHLRHSVPHLRHSGPHFRHSGLDPESLSPYLQNPRPCSIIRKHNQLQQQRRMPI